MTPASGVAVGSICASGSDERLERHLIILMASRLALSTLSLVIGLGLDALGGNVTISEWNGFYATVAVAFVATLIYRPFVGRIERPRLFAGVNIATDIVLVSALVLFSGGRESVFTFLYVMVAIYAAMLFRPRAALACAGLASAAYGVVMLAGQWGWVATAGGPGNPAILVTTWIVHAGALILVSALASFLVGELERTGAALDQRTSDLAHLQTLHERTVESLMSGLLTTDPACRVTSFNQEAERIVNMSRAEAIGLHMDEIIPGLERLIEDSHEGVSSARARMPYHNRAGQALHLGIGSYVLRDGEGAASGHVVIFQDVSDVVKMEQDLRRSERLAAVGELSASIAHEIRNPLAAISGSIQVMRDYIDDGAGESKRLMEIAEREIDRLNDLITDFLQFARPGRANLEPVVISEAVADVLEMFGSADPGRIRVDVEEGLAAYADAGQLRQVLWNLLINAEQAMPEGGVVGVAAQAISEVPAQDPNSEDRMENTDPISWAEISVMDRGVGVPEAAVDRVFDPFFTTKRGGSGLGLATVHRIVEDHGGTVRLETSSEGWSTVIRVRLPLAKATR